jgi:parallel beta-helix repeat protein
MLGLALGLFFTPASASARTFYVDAAKGNDFFGATAAQNPNFPWRTIKRAMGVAVGGDTVLVKPGTYGESVESKRDGTPTSLIVLRSTVVGGAVIQPPAGTNGFFISHNYHTLDGFKVTGAVTGMKLGAHDGGNGPVVGLLIQNNTISNNSSNGIQVTNGLSTEIAFNTVFGNGQNGISYSGNSSLIHDNVVHDNAQFGIYVKDGVDHQVFNNQAYGNAGGDLQILGSLLASAKTYYVDAAIGNNGNNSDEAQSPATPWRTITRAVADAQAGDSIIVMPGLYAETVESKRDGASGKPILIKAATPGTVTVNPPAGSPGFFISHNYHTLDGLIVTGSSVNGVQAGPHDGGGAEVTGIVISGNHVFGNGLAGIKLSNATGAAVMHNVVNNNTKDGIVYAGAQANIFNNLVYSNFGTGGEYGITISSGSGHKITNNTVYGNVKGGIRLGTTTSSPVAATALNNIVSGNAGVGIKEPANCCASQLVDFNDVFGNASANYDLSTTPVGANSISSDPGFVSPSNADFRLGRLATGQAADSPCIDRGSAGSDTLGLGGRTAFTDKAPDTGLVDLGYHGTLLYPTQGTVTMTAATLTFNTGQGNDGFTLSANLAPGTGSDGIEPGINYAEVSFGSFQFTLAAAGFQQQPDGSWNYTSPGQLSSGTFVKQGNGSVDITVQASGLNLSYSDSPITIQVRIGDDFGSSTVALRGTLQYP